MTKEQWENMSYPAAVNLGLDGDGPDAALAWAQTDYTQVTQQQAVEIMKRYVNHRHSRVMHDFIFLPMRTAPYPSAEAACRDRMWHIASFDSEGVKFYEVAGAEFIPWGDLGYNTSSGFFNAKTMPGEENIYKR